MGPMFLPPLDPQTRSEVAAWPLWLLLCVLPVLLAATALAATHTGGV